MPNVLGHEHWTVVRQIVGFDPHPATLRSYNSLGNGADFVIVCNQLETFQPSRINDTPNPRSNPFKNNTRAAHRN